MNPKLVKPAIIFGAVILISFYFMFFSGGGSDETGNQTASSDDDQALSALFGGGGTGNHSQGAKSGAEAKSIFDSGFWESGVPENVEEDVESEFGDDDSGILEPVSEGNPVNPQTGTPYTDSMMKQFDSLREKFPGNSIIPKRLTPEEKTAQEQKNKEMDEIRRKMASRDANDTEINSYYDDESKKIQDRLELLEYVLQNQGTNMSDEIRTKYNEVLEMNRKQIKRFEEARDRALKRTGGGNSDDEEDSVGGGSTPAFRQEKMQSSGFQKRME